MQINKRRWAGFLARHGRRLVRYKTPLRPLVLWLWKKAVHYFEDSPIGEK